MLVGIVAGKAYEPAVTIALAISPRILAQAGVSVLAASLAGVGYTRYHTLGCLVGLLGVLGCDLLFLPRWGLVGGGAASSIGYLLAALVFWFGYSRTQGVTLREFAHAVRVETPAAIRLMVASARRAVSGTKSPRNPN
jgi:O-antigen/teichoic acid export membrane protein